MKRLPLYDGDLTAVVERADRLAVDSTCTRCAFHAGARKVCMPAEGIPGGLLVVGDYPGRDEEAAGRPFFGKTGAYIRGFLAKHWNGPIALDNAIRCVPKGEISEEHVDACRPYLSRTVDQVQATRVFAMGATAIEAVLGRSLRVMSVRRGYGWTSTGVPVFLFPNPVVALRNRILRARLEDSMHWALSVDASTLVKPSDFRDFHCVETPEDAASAVAVLAMSPWVSYDTETAGVMFDSSFSLLSVALASPRGEVFVWGQSALQEPAVCDPLVQFLSDPRLKKIGQNLKYDLHAIELGLGVQAKGCVGDTQLWRHLLESDVDDVALLFAEGMHVDVTDQFGLDHALLALDALIDRGNVRRRRHLGVGEVECEGRIETQRKRLLVQHRGDADAVRHFEDQADEGRLHRGLDAHGRTLARDVVDLLLAQRTLGGAGAIGEFTHDIGWQGRRCAGP